MAERPKLKEHKLETIENRLPQLPVFDAEYQDLMNRLAAQFLRRHAALDLIEHLALDADAAECTPQDRTAFIKGLSNGGHVGAGKGKR